MLDASLETVSGVIAEGIVVDHATKAAEHWRGQRAVRPRPEVHTLQVVIEQVSADRRRPCRALADVMITIHKQAVAAGVVHDVVVGNEDTGVALRPIHKDDLRAAWDIGSVHHILIDGDIRTAPVHPDGLGRITGEDVIDDLHVVVGPGVRIDAALDARSPAAELKSVDGDQPADGDGKCPSAGGTAGMTTASAATRPRASTPTCGPWSAIGLAIVTFSV